MPSNLVNLDPVLKKKALDTALRAKSQREIGEERAKPDNSPRAVRERFEAMQRSEARKKK